MSKVTFDYSKAASFISEEEVGYMSKLVDNAKKELLAIKSWKRLKRKKKRSFQQNSKKKSVN